MAIKPRVTAAPAARTTAPAPKQVVAKETKATATTPKGEVSKTLEVREFDAKEAVCNLGIQRSFTVKRDDDFIKVGVQVNMPCTMSELTSGAAATAIQDLIKDFIDTEAAAAMEQYTALTGNGGEDDGEGGEEAEEAALEEAEEEAEPEAEGEELTAETVQALPNRVAVIKAIEDYGLDQIDPDQFPKTKSGTDAMKAAIIETYLGEEEEEEAEADEAEEEVEEETEESGDSEITEDDIRAMKRNDLIALINANELEVDPSKHPKVAALQDAVIAALAAAGEEEEQEEAEEAAEQYTEAELNKMSLDDLKEIYKAWSLGKFPSTGTPIVQKKAAVKAILKAQAG